MRLTTPEFNYRALHVHCRVCATWRDTFGPVLQALPGLVEQRLAEAEAEDRASGGRASNFLRWEADHASALAKDWHSLLGLPTPSRSTSVVVRLSFMVLRFAVDDGSKLNPQRLGDVPEWHELRGHCNANWKRGRDSVANLWRFDIARALKRVDPTSLTAAQRHAIIEAAEEWRRAERGSRFTNITEHADGGRGGTGPRGSIGKVAMMRVGSRVSDRCRPIGVGRRHAPRCP